MKRVRRVVSYLLLGMATTMAIAWARPLWMGTIPYTEIADWTYPENQTIMSRGNVIAGTSGWPLDSMCTRTWDEMPRGPRAEWSCSWLDGWSVPNPFYSATLANTAAERPWWITLPVRPVWGGFAVDTMLYGCLWAAPFIGSSVAIRSLRRRRGLCPKCAYDLLGLAPGAKCPECGA